MRGETNIDYKSIDYKSLRDEMIVEGKNLQKEPRRGDTLLYMVLLKYNISTLPH